MKHLQKLIVCLMAIFTMVSCDDSKIVTIENQIKATQGSFTMDEVEIRMYVGDLYAGSKYIQSIEPSEVSKKIRVPKNTTRLKLSCKFSLHRCFIDGGEDFLVEFAKNTGEVNFTPNFFTDEDKTEIVISDKTDYHKTGK